MKPIKRYEINQCALYKLRSKTRLAVILNHPKERLLELAKSKSNYRIFELKEEICPFTKKRTKARMVQEPKSELKKVHARIQKLISRIEPPDYGHAAVKRRSYRTNAEAHISSLYVATLDIRKFYPSTRKSLVRNFFSEQLLCSPDVADILTNICCFSDNKDLRAVIGLPTGSPLSPILSLYVNKPMFDKLDQYAKSEGLVFTCYVDDLTFSGNSIPGGIGRKIEEIVYSHGHKIASEKTKIFSPRHTKHITGVAISNGEIKVPYSRFKKARAIEEKIQSTPPSDLHERLALHRKLSGLLGEAAFLDNRYTPWAQRSYAELRISQSNLSEAGNGLSAANHQSNTTDIDEKNEASSNP